MYHGESGLLLVLPHDSHTHSVVEEPQGDLLVRIVQLTTQDLHNINAPSPITTVVTSSIAIQYCDCYHHKCIRM